MFLVLFCRVFLFGLGRRCTTGSNACSGAVGWSTDWGGVIASEAFLLKHQLKPVLSWYHLIALGVGAIVGTGILTLIGVGAGKAGPAVIVSFVFAGLVCACAVLAYAEMATMIPMSGGAYTYSHVVIGGQVAWVIGWSLILEYSLVVSAVAVGWRAMRP